MSGEGAKAAGNVAGAVVRRAADHPGQTAVRVPRRSGGGIAFTDESFRSWEQKVRAAEARLGRQGIGKGTRVLVLARPGLELLTAVFALLWRGAVPVVIDAGMGRRRFLACVQRSRPEAVVGIPLALALSRLFPRPFATVRARLSTRALLRPDTSPPDPAACPVPVAPDDPVALLFTSGSTGPAKGVVYRSRHLAAQLEALRAAFSIEEGEVDFPMLPVFALFNPALGMTTVIPPMHPARPARADGRLLLEVMVAAGVTNSFGSPVLWRKLARAGAAEGGATVASLRRMLAAGAAVPPDLVGELRPVFPQAQLYSPYGATEALPLTLIDGDAIERGAEATREGRGVCVGRPLPRVDLRILPVAGETLAPADLDRPEPPGTIGEIVVSGPVVTAEYDALPEATRRSKVGGPDGRLWHRMGDAGYLDGEGRLWFVGRVAERVVLDDGAVLYTECVEQIFLRHPRVERCALLGIGPAAHRTPALVVQPVEGAYPRSETDLATWKRELRELAEAHPAAGAVRHFFFRRSFPVDPRHNAKIHRLAMAREYYAHGWHPTE